MLNIVPSGLMSTLFRGLASIFVLVAAIAIAMLISAKDNPAQGDGGYVLLPEVTGSVPQPAYADDSGMVSNVAEDEGEIAFEAEADAELIDENEMTGEPQPLTDREIEYLIRSDKEKEAAGY